MKWETIKKYSRNGYFIATGVLALLVSITSLYGFIHSSGPERNPAFFGRWESQYQYPVNGSTMAFNGVTEFFRNGKYNVNGKFEISGSNADKPYSVVLRTHGSGTWVANTEYLTFTLTGLHITPKSFKIGDLDMPVLALEKITGLAFPDLNKEYVPGSSDELQIISQEQQKIVLQGKDPSGKAFIIVSTRQP